MNAADIEKYCMSLKGTTTDVKWGNDLCYLIGEKMYCVHSLKGALNTSFKCTPENFGELTERNGIIPAPYVAKYHWVRIEDPKALSVKEYKQYIKESYEMILAKLSTKLKKKILGR